MKVLIVSENFIPVQSPRAFRTYELAKELARQGHEVKVICLTGQKGIVDYDYDTLEKETNIKISVVPLKHKLPQNRYVARIASLLFAWPLSEITVKLPHIIRNESKYDMLISIAAPHQIHWGISRIGASVKEKFKMWVADCGDPYMGNKADTFTPPFYFKYIEKRWCRLCDYITVPIDSAKEGYYKEFWNKIRVIPQGFNFEESKPNRAYVKNTVPTFIFAGGFIPGLRDPKLFLEYLAHVEAEFRFVIYTNNDALLQPYKQQFGAKLEVRSYIPRTELLQELSSADFLVNFENGNTSVQVPSKLIDYALSGRPVLSVNSYRIDEENIERFLHADYSGKMQMPNLDQYDIRVVAKQFIELYNEKMSKQ